MSRVLGVLAAAALALGLAACAGSAGHSCCTKAPDGKAKACEMKAGCSGGAKGDHQH